VPEVDVLGAPQSNFVRTVRMALEEKGVPYTLVPVRPHTPEIDAVHPLGKIPCLRHGDFSLCESQAIAAYIDRAFPGPALFPGEVQEAAVIEQWVSICNTAVIPCIQPYMAAYYFPGTADGQPDKAAVAAAFPKVEAQLKLLDRTVTATGYLAGARFSYADMNILPVLAYLAGLPESGGAMKALPALTRYFETHSKRPSFVNTVPPPFSELPPRVEHGKG